MFTPQAMPFHANELRDFSPELIRPMVGAATPCGSKQIECVRCNQLLPLRLSLAGEEPARWLCSECGVPYAALCIREQLAQLAPLVRLDDQYFDTFGQPAIPEEMCEVVARHAERNQHPEVVERRRSPRVAQSLVVPAVPLGDDFNPASAAANLIVSDISREGIGLVHSQAIENDLVALELRPGEDDPIQVIVRVVRRRPLQGHYYELGGVFLVRLGSVTN